MDENEHIRIDLRIPIDKVEFIGTRFTDGLKEVCSDFETAKIIRILTYGNIASKRLESIQKLEDKDIKIIVGYYQRFDPINKSYTMGNNRISEVSIKKQLGDLKDVYDHTKYRSKKVSLNLAFTSHAKIIGTENIVYIGSANFSNQSMYNYEAGFIIRDKEVIKQIYKDYFDKIITAEYKGDKYDAMRAYLGCMQTRLIAIYVALSSFTSFEESYNCMCSFSFEYKKFLEELGDANVTCEECMPESANPFYEDLVIPAEGHADAIEESFGLECVSTYELFADMYEDYFREEQGVGPNEEWINEDERYVPLKDRPNRDIMIDEMWCKMVHNKKGYHDAMETVRYLFDAIERYKEIIPKQTESFDILQNEAIRMGTDMNVDK